MWTRYRRPARDPEGRSYRRLPDCRLIRCQRQRRTRSRVHPASKELFPVGSPRACSPRSFRSPTRNPSPFRRPATHSTRGQRLATPLCHYFRHPDCCSTPVRPRPAIHSTPSRRLATHPPRFRHPFRCSTPVRLRPVSNSTPSRRLAAHLSRRSTQGRHRRMNGNLTRRPVLHRRPHRPWAQGSTPDRRLQGHLRRSQSLRPGSIRSRHRAISSIRFLYPAPSSNQPHPEKSLDRHRYRAIDPSPLRCHCLAVSSAGYLRCWKDPIPNHSLE